ncbi:MAG: thiol oxidoreductase, partial [Sphingomonadales bacterium]|nr:thiol oxidoreductase [Sphingomonadales bacterium]
LGDRLAQPLGGVGLLEAIPEADILALADPEDADGDGISGRAARATAGGAPRLGRFGWKAEAASLAEMAAAAFATDMGLSTPLAPHPAGDCTAAQAACLAAPSGEDPGLRDGREVSGEALGLVATYLAALGQPAREALDDAQLLAGKQAFHDAGCIACHRPKFVTARDPADPARSFQLIWPYSDLLLHDMGPDLADALPGHDAAPAEWRTAPLWGLTRSAAPGQPLSFLHDGRARSPLEAVLWHGGEAAPARDRVVAMPPATRAALIRFLESL